MGINYFFDSKFKNLTNIMIHFLQKIFITLTLLTLTQKIYAQNLTISEPINVFNAESYALSAKINDRFLFFYWHAELLTVNALDNNLRNIWQKEINIEKKYEVKILDVIPNKISFNVIARMRKRNYTYIKVLKFDGQAKLLDSATVCSWKESLNESETELFISDDKRVVVALNPNYYNENITCAFSLDSLRPIWKVKWKSKNPDFDDRKQQWLVTNDGKTFLFTDENSPSKKARQFDVLQFNTNQTVSDFKINTGEIIANNTLFNFDNKNKKLIAVGCYSNKNNGHNNGTFYLSIPENNTIQAHWQITPFTDEFVTSYIGKKVTDNKGVDDLKVQRIINRSDGGVVALIEKTRITERTTAGSNNTNTIIRNGHTYDFYCDNLFSLSLDSLGTKEWSQVYVKHQVSQDDDARFSSFFIMRSPTSLRLIFNEDVERNTNVYEYVIKNGGEVDRHVVLNTEAKDIYLRIRDAVQFASNEILIPSEGNKSVKLVKISW